MNNKKLNSLIKEEINSLLSEKEYANDEYVDNKSIDLQQQYDELNQLLFNNKLPKVPLMWDPIKRAFGVVRGYYNRGTREVSIKELAISKIYKLTYRQFRNILAHEMIHVYQMSIMKEKGGHGWDFQREMRRINGMGLGFEITEKNGEDIPVSDDIMAKGKTRTLIAIVLNIDGKYDLIATTPNAYNSGFNGIVNLYDGLVNKRNQYKSVEITAIETQNPELMKFPLARSFERGVRYTNITDRLLEQLLNDKIIKNVVIKRDVPVAITEDNEPISNSSAWEEIEIS